MLRQPACIVSSQFSGTTPAVRLCFAGFSPMRNRRRFLLLAPTYALGALAMTSTMTTPASAQVGLPERTVTVSATGTVAAAPDIAHISTGVASEARTAREAMELNTKAMRALLDGLKALGLEGKDIQTMSFAVEPQHQHYKDGKPPTVVGYRVVNQVRIVQRDIGRLGETLDKAISLGANQMGGISFEVSNAETLRDDARRRAMENALRRAQLYASAVGGSVGRALTISEGGGTPGPRPLASGRMAMASAVPIEAGEETLSVSVNVTWELK